MLGSRFAPTVLIAVAVLFSSALSDISVVTSEDSSLQRNLASYPTSFPLRNPTTYPTGFPSNSPSHYPTRFPLNYPSPFPTNSPTSVTCVPKQELRIGSGHISLLFAICPSEAGFAAFLKAAERWNSIIASNPLPSGVTIGSSFNVARECGLKNSVTIKKNYVFDHLLIVAETVDIDGVDSILGQAGPCLYVGPENGAFTVLGIMQFDSEDIEAMEQSGVLDDVILHEMAHVLGVGTFWSDVGILASPIFEYTASGETVINEDNIPKYTGALGVAQYSALSGATKTTIPVEDGRDANGDAFFDVSKGEGQGSIDSHWKISDFEDELMVFAIDPSEASHPLSKMTIASLRDLGYTVDLSKADAYILPEDRVTKSLRTAKSAKKKFSLQNDIMKIKPKEIGQFNLELKKRIETEKASSKP